jgi:hypothetical protein
MEPAAEPPQALPAALAPTLGSPGYRVLGPGGKPYCQVWPAKSLPPAAAKTAEESVSLPMIPHGALLGVVEFPAAAADRRGNSVKQGIYTMRYSIYPADGNHMGAAPQRDFVILIPAAEDSPAAPLPNYEQLMALSRKTIGRPHPAVLSLFPSSLEALPVFEKEAEHDWVLHFKIGGLPLALILAGKAE